MTEVIGLTFREDRIDGAVVRRRVGGARVFNTFSLSLGDQADGALRAKLRELGVRTRRVHVGLPRRRAVVKAIDLPGVAGADLRRMVGFELERHLPFPAADALFDFHVLDQTPGRPVRVLLVAVERRVFERISQLLRDAGLVPRLLDVAIHSVAALVARGGEGRGPDATAIVHLEETEAELAVVRDGRPVLSRAFTLPANGKERGQTLAEEFRRSLTGLSPLERESLSDVTVTGGGALPGTDWADLPLHTTVTLPPGMTGTADAASLPALAMALRQPNRGPLKTNLMPEELRPRPFPWPLAVTAGLAAATLLLALAIPGMTALRDERRLSALNRQIERLAPDVRQVEQVAATVERLRREAETLRAFEGQHVRSLPLLRELTEILPADVWLTNLSVDRKGIELAGFAGAASQLIPLLEASPSLERVEFTSPVTKGRDREQFRLKAAWERPPGAPTAAPPAASPPARPRTPPPVRPPVKP